MSQPASVLDNQPAPEKKETYRELVLKSALEIVMKDRNAQYGDPEDNFSDIASFWTTYLDHPISSVDVAAMMVLVKISRVKTSPEVLDHYIDGAGYFACGADAMVGMTQEQIYWSGGDDIG